MQYIIYALIIAFAGAVSVVTGFGFATITLAVLSLFLPIKVALLFVAMLHLLVSLYKVWAFKGGWNRISLAFIIGGTLFSLIGAELSGLLSTRLLKHCLGLLLITYPLFVLYRPKLRISHKTPFALLGGSLSGFFAGLIGVGGAIRSFFVSLYDLPKDVYVATNGMIALAIDVTRIAVYTRQTPIDRQELILFFMVSIPALSLGLWLGKQLVNWIPQDYFRLVVSCALALFGLGFILVEAGLI